jgi:hypothetical protein
MIPRILMATAGALALTLAGCASAERLSNAPALSRSKGAIRFEKTLEGGTRILIRVENLAEPEDLFPPGYAYVAWVQSAPEAPAQNVGALTVDPYRTGELKTTTPLSEFKFFVTAEPSSDEAQPTGPPLLWTRHVDPTMAAAGDESSRFARSDAR